VLCNYSFNQAIRARVTEKVRHGQLEIVLDVPASNQLLAWASTAHHPLDGHVSFFKENEFMAHETVAFTGGECEGYQKLFEAGAPTIGSYRYSLNIAATRLELLPGGPAAT
jgi:aspartyl/asparaginyl-tRNA synthetase